MTTLLLRPILRPQVLGVGLGLSLATYHTIYQRPLRMDMLSADTSRRNAQTPAVRNGQLTPGAVRQISSGSIIGVSSSLALPDKIANAEAGLCAGLAVSTFSKPLTLILGLLIVGIQVSISHNRLKVLYREANNNQSGHQVTASMCYPTKDFKNTSLA